MSRASDVQDELAYEWSSFLAVWHETRANWKDEVAARFEKRFIEQWEADMRSYFAALKALETEIRASQREVR